MTKTICYQTNEMGVFLHLVDAYPFPMEDRLNIPYMAVQLAPPPIPDGHLARWISAHRPMEPAFDTEGTWVIEEIPAPPHPDEKEKASNEEIQAQA